MSTMTIERRRKLEDHIMYAYLFKHAGIGHGSNGWDLIYGPVGDSPCIFAKPSLTGINGGFEINWFIPNEHGNESQPYKLYITAGTNTPYSDALVAKRELTDAKDHIEEINRCLNQANDIIDNWKSNTCCETSTEARKHIEELMEENADLLLELAAWQDATSCKVPKEAESRIINLLNDHGIDTLRIDSMKRRIAGWERSADYWGNKFAEWKKATECDTPEEAKKRIDGILDDLSKADDDIIDLGIEIKKLQDRIKASGRNMLWITSNGLLISESDKTVEALEAQVDKLNNEIGNQTSHINDLDARIKELSNVISDWQNATECKLPSMAKEKIEHYKRRLGNAVQAASCAAKHLDNITF